MLNTCDKLYNCHEIFPPKETIQFSHNHNIFLLGLKRFWKSLEITSNTVEVINFSAEVRLEYHINDAINSKKTRTYSIENKENGW